MNELVFIDLFCGAGGVTTGIEQAAYRTQKIAKVVACVNHDPLAIASHFSNHPKAHHFTEDIRTLDMKPLKKIISKYRLDTICLWASLECTNFSKAKGGKPREADSRTLANDLFRYVDEIFPDYIFIENVEEFMSWGPLDEIGKPISKYEGRDYIKWVEGMKARGFNYDFRMLNSADYGAHTSRKRYFGIFARKGLPIFFPQPTHSKNPQDGLMGKLELWKPVREVLDFDDTGESIFTRKKALSENTLKRIYAGLIKYVAGGKEAFLMKYNSNNQKSGINSGADINKPSPTIATQVRLGVVQPVFISKYYSGDPENKNQSIEDPAGAITTIDHHAIIQPFLIKYNSGENTIGLDEICSTLSTRDRLGIVKPIHFIQKTYSGEHNHQSVDSPAGTLLGVNHYGLVSAFLLNPQFSSNGRSLEDPCFTLIARMDKRPPYLVQVSEGRFGIAVYDKDSEILRKIKEFMALYSIVDIKMRMLRVPELLKIQGFPAGYVLKGTQSDHKKFIGNSVVPGMAKAIIEAIYQGLEEKEKVA